MLDLRGLSRVGETSASLLEEEEAGIADRDFGEGIGCEERCRAGDDIDPCLRDGVM